MRAHDILEGLIGTEFAEIEQLVVEQCTGSLAAATGDLEALAHRRVSNTLANLRADLEAFRVGWTAPRPERWHQRHPLIFGVLMLIFGAIITQSGNWLFSHSTTHEDPPVKEIKPAPSTSPSPRTQSSAAAE
jgi:hypothetical protein